MPKTKSYTHANAKEQIATHLVDELADSLFYGGGVKYRSLNMKKGIDVEAMTQPTLLQLIKIGVLVDPPWRISSTT